MRIKRNRYSYLIRPISVLIDVLIIIGVIFFVSNPDFLSPYFILFFISSWLIIAYNIEFYSIYRYANSFRILKILAVQFILFIVVYFSYFGAFKKGIVINNQWYMLSLTFGCVSVFKFLFFFTLRRYRSEGKNYRNVIVIGIDDSSKRIIKLFKKKSEFGYRYLGVFSDSKTNQLNYLGNLEKSKSYILANKVDEIYCALSVLSSNQVKEFTKFANENSIVIKLIPDSNELYSKSLGAEYYDNLLVLNVKKLPFEILDNHFLKRSFDIVFSFLMIIFVMSWVTPLLWILIKLESKGPLFFSQNREGIRGETFTCYKFRSMRLNALSDKIHATKDDKRVTRIGAFLRRTSLDELPQFFNVLKGDMSVVGPRPHMKSLSLEYQKEIDNYIERFAVKPGITGLAQVSGYRGEVKKKADIKNRIRLDIFYIENWSFFLDLKIIFQTLVNIFTGEEKAY